MRVSITPAGIINRNKSYVVVTGTKTQTGSIGFVDESGRDEIYCWAQMRDRKKSKWIRSIKLYLCGKKLLKTFFSGISFVVLINIILTMMCTFLCLYYDIQFNIPEMLFITSLIYPLSFLINSDYNRRESALIFMAKIKSSVNSLFLLGREYDVLLHKNIEFLHFKNKLKMVLFHISVYLCSYQQKKRKYLLKVIYEDFSDLSQIIKYYAVDIMTKAGATVSVASLFRIHGDLIGAFEKVRCIRDYRTPLSTRAFTKIISFISPIILSPLYISFAKQVPKTENWSPYIFAFFVSFILGYLQSVQDRLYDPFTGLTNDAIDIHDLLQWVEDSIGHTDNRIYDPEKKCISEISNKLEPGQTEKNEQGKPKSSDAYTRFVGRFEESDFLNK